MSIQAQGDVQDLSAGSRIVTAIQGRPVANTPPASSQVMGWNSSNKQWTPLYPPGYEIGYDQITSPVNVTGLAASTATTIISGSSHSFDGTVVMAEFFSPFILLPAVAGQVMNIALFEGSTNISIISGGLNPVSGSCEIPAPGDLRFTPSAGSHTYSIKAWVTSTTGTPAIQAGTGTGGAVAPSFLRFIKV